MGVEGEQAEQVTAATQRLEDAGLATFEEYDTSCCCYAPQDKVYVVKAEMFSISDIVAMKKEYTRGLAHRLFWL